MWKITYVSFLQSWRIINTISCHSNNGPLSLAAFYDDQFLLRGSPGKYNFSVVLQDII